MITKLKLIFIYALILLIALITIVLTWSYRHNNNPINPLPVPSSELIIDKEIDRQPPAEFEQVNICADKSIQPALKNLSVRFERRYPHVNTNINFYPTDTLILDCNLKTNDLILFTKPIALEQEQQIIKANQSAMATQSTILITFNYTLKNDERYEGLITSDKASAKTFRNFLLSSLGQDVFVKYGYRNVEGYSNDVNQLFNNKKLPLNHTN